MINQEDCILSIVILKIKATGERTDDAVKRLDERDKGVIFKNCAPFINCKTEINCTEIDNAKDIDV